jgi:hypothetical protein
MGSGMNQSISSWVSGLVFLLGSGSALSQAAAAELPGWCGKLPAKPFPRTRREGQVGQGSFRCSLFEHVALVGVPDAE